MPALAAKLREAFAPHPPLALRLSGGGTFPPKRPARVAWIGVLGDRHRRISPRCRPTAVGAAVEAVGFEPEERPFRPHVTLARCDPPWPRDAVEKLAAAFPGTIGQPFVGGPGRPHGEQAEPAGARYTVVEAFPLERRGMSQGFALGSRRWPPT